MLKMGDGLLNEQISIIDIIDMLLRRWWLILVSAIICGALVFSYTTVFIDPTYESGGALYVNSASQTRPDGSVTAATITASQQLVNTYSEILQRRTFLEKVAQDLNNKYTVDEIRNMILMVPVNETEILEITVVSKSSYDAYRIAKSILEHAPDELIRVVEAGSVKILDNAKENETPIAPNVRNNTLIGVLIGILLGALIAVLMALFDTRIKNGEEISQKYPEPLLGEIPNLGNDERERRGK